MTIDPYFSGGGFPVLFALVFCAVLTVFLVILIRGLVQWNKNNHLPQLIVPATVVAKRINVSGSENSTTTWHYVTFQLSGGERMEFSVTGQEYGMLVEGDCGQLTYQGTRYLGFER